MPIDRFAMHRQVENGLRGEAGVSLVIVEELLHPGCKIRFDLRGDRIVCQDIEKLLLGVIGHKKVTGDALGHIGLGRCNEHNLLVLQRLALGADGQGVDDGLAGAPPEHPRAGRVRLRHRAGDRQPARGRPGLGRGHRQRRAASGLYVVARHDEDLARSVRRRLLTSSLQRQLSGL